MNPMIPMSLALDTPVEFVRGIGPRRAQILSLNGIHSVENLLQYLPFRYEDRTHFKPISKLKAEQEAVIQGEVMSIGHYTPPWKKMKIFEMVVSDGSASLGIKFFNQPYLRKVFRKGQRVVLFGVPRKSDFNQVLDLINPEFEIASGRSHPGVHSERIVPVYRRLGSLTTRTLRKVIFQLLACLDPELDDPLPESIRERYGFPHRRWAFQQIHFPSSPNKRHTELQSVEQPNQTLARKRFVFEEFFLLQCALQAVKIKRNRVPKGRMMRTNDQILRMIKSILPFHPTQAQKRVLKEIVEDLCRPEVMNRLLQGDVGSGKTIVAIQAMIVVMENNYQVALMAPTEILAEQHHQTIRHYLKNTGYRIGFLTSQVKGSLRKKCWRGSRQARLIWSLERMHSSKREWSLRSWHWRSLTNSTDSVCYRDPVS